MTKFIFHNATPHVHFIHMFLFIFLYYIFAVALSLHLQKIAIPQYKFRGETAILECDYELNGNHEDSFDDDNENQNFNFFHQNPPDKETLYSVKWYKDNEEFYRFRPKSKPQRNIYKGEFLSVS